MDVYIYDFDDTIYDGDSTKDFYFYCLKKHKKICKYWLIQISNIILYKIKIKSKKEAKEKFFIFLKDIPNIEEEVNLFWEKNISKIKSWYQKKNHEKDIIISASPEFLLKVPCEKLGTYKLIATKVNTKTGKFLTENCYGSEKVKRLKKEQLDYNIIEAYSDSLSDTPILKEAKQGYIVKNNKIIPFVNNNKD